MIRPNTTRSASFASPEMQAATSQPEETNEFMQKVNQWTNWAKDNPAVCLSGAVVLGVALGWLIKTKR